MEPPLHTRAMHAFRRFVAAWLAVLFALVPATAIGGVALALGLAIMEAPHWTAGTLGFIPFMVLMSVFYAIPLGVAFSLLALPFLPFRRWIVGRRPPHLKWGYAAVALYGPALILIANHARADGLALGAAATYEVIALGATLIYAKVAEAFGLFPPPPPSAEVFA